MSRRLSALDLLSKARQQIRRDMATTIERVPAINYGAALYAITMARKYTIQANRELGRPVVLSRTRRRRKRSRR